MKRISRRSRGLLLVFAAIACGVSYGFAIKSLLFVPDLFGQGMSGSGSPWATVWLVYFTGLVAMLLALIVPRNRRQVIGGLAELRGHTRLPSLAFSMLAYTGSLMGYYLLMATGVRIGNVNFLFDLDSALVIMISFAWLCLRGRQKSIRWRDLCGVILACVGWWIVAKKGALTNEQIHLALWYVVGSALGDVLVAPSAERLDARALVLVRWVFVLFGVGAYGWHAGEIQRALPGMWKLVTWQAPGSGALYLVAGVLVGLFAFRFWALRFVAVWELNAWMFSQMFLVFGVTLLVDSERVVVDNPFIWAIGAVMVSVGLFFVSFGRSREAETS